MNPFKIKKTTTNRYYNRTPFKSANHWLPTHCNSQCMYHFFSAQPYDTWSIRSLLCTRHHGKKKESYICAAHECVGPGPCRTRLCTVLSYFTTDPPWPFGPSVPSLLLSRSASASLHFVNNPLFHSFPLRPPTPAPSNNRIAYHCPFAQFCTAY